MRIGTRGSALALWQARTVARLILDTGGPVCEIVVIRTAGDEGPPAAPVPPAVPEPAEGTRHKAQGTNQDRPNIKAQFVKEIEDALLDGRIDLAVHSSKDLPAALPDGLMLAAALEREDPRDALLMPAGSVARGFDAIKKALGGAPVIGTSSVRRQAQLRAAMPGAMFAGIRGNVDTRLRKLDAGECDVLVLAAAGVKRLGLEPRISALLAVDVCVPAPGQGIVAVEMRDDAGAHIRDAVKRISDPDAETMLIAERAVVATLGGGCQMPLGVLATLDGQQLDVHGVVTSLDGRAAIRGAVRGNRGGAAAAGEKLAAQLLSKGAGDILK
jgi:hydroxymethylbilane synthase